VFFHETNALAQDSTVSTHNSGVAPTAEVSRLSGLSGFGVKIGVGLVVEGVMSFP
jgi:hypothetical protein